MRGKRLKMMTFGCYLIVFQCVDAFVGMSDYFIQKNEKIRENSSPLLVLAVVANF
jgi:hypothetical protein